MTIIIIWFTSNSKRTKSEIYSPVLNFLIAYFALQFLFRKDHLMITNSTKSGYLPSPLHSIGFQLLICDSKEKIVTHVITVSYTRILKFNHRPHSLVGTKTQMLAHSCAGRISFEPKVTVLWSCDSVVCVFILSNIYSHLCLLFKSI